MAANIHSNRRSEWTKICKIHIAVRDNNKIVETALKTIYLSKYRADIAKWSQPVDYAQVGLINQKKEYGVGTWLSLKSDNF